MCYFLVPAWIWKNLDHSMAWLGVCRGSALQNDMIQSICFTMAFTIWGTLIKFPSDYYFTFVIEEKWGFNKTTMKTFVIDKLKGLGLSAVLVSIMLSVILYVIKKAGENLIFYLSIVTIGFLLIIQILFPIFIIPCFYTYSDLKEGELRDAIFKESEKTKIPVSQIKVIDGSTRSSHSNAFVTGFSAFRKVVIFDTLIE